MSIVGHNDHNGTLCPKMSLKPQHPVIPYRQRLPKTLIIAHSSDNFPTYPHVIYTCIARSCLRFFAFSLNSDLNLEVAEQSAASAEPTAENALPSVGAAIFNTQITNAVHKIEGKFHLHFTDESLKSKKCLDEKKYLQLKCILNVQRDSKLEHT